MAAESISSLFAGNPVSHTDLHNAKFEVAGDFGAGSVSGATTFTEMIAAFVLYLQANGLDGTAIGAGSSSTGTFTTLSASGAALSGITTAPSVFDGTGDFWLRGGGVGVFQLGPSMQIEWHPSVAHSGTADLILLRRGVGNYAITGGGTSDAMLSIGAASGTGGGVLLLHGISVGPSPVSSDVAIYYDGFNCIIDKSIAADGSGLTGVPGTVTYDTGWGAPESTGDKTVSVQDYDSTTLDGMTAALNLVLVGFGTAIAALADQVESLTKKLQAVETASANGLAPNA